MGIPPNRWFVLSLALALIGLESSFAEDSPEEKMKKFAERAKANSEQYYDEVFDADGNFRP